MGEPRETDLDALAFFAHVEGLAAAASSCRCRAGGGRGRCGDPDCGAPAPAPGDYSGAPHGGTGCDGDDDCEAPCGGAARGAGVGGHGSARREAGERHGDDGAGAVAVGAAPGLEGVRQQACRCGEEFVWRAAGSGCRRWSAEVRIS